MKNPYASSLFAESALMETWKYIYSKKNFALADKFDELHQLYIEGLEDWVKEIDCILDQKYGLCDSSNGLNEYVEYPLRVFDSLRRLSYLGFYYLFTRIQGWF